MTDRPAKRTYFFVHACCGSVQDDTTGRRVLWSDRTGREVDHTRRGPGAIAPANEAMAPLGKPHTQTTRATHLSSAAYAKWRGVDAEPIDRHG